MPEWFECWFDSPYYHILYNNRDESEAKKLIDNLILNGQYSPETRILDLACGKGRHAIYLNKLGFHVTGIDLSESSIKEASQFQNQRLSFKKQDMRDPLPKSSFDLVLNLFTSFGYFENTDQNLAVLSNIHSSLSPKARLVIDFMNTTRVINEMIADERIVKQGIEFHIERQVSNGFIKKKISFSVEGKNHEYCERVQLFELSDFILMFSKTGFELKTTCGDYNLGKFDAFQSDRLILIADKTADE